MGNGVSVSTAESRHHGTAHLAIPRHQTVHGTADHHPRVSCQRMECPSLASRIEKPLHRAHAVQQFKPQVVTTATARICTRGCQKPTPMSAVVGRARASNDPSISFVSCASAGFGLDFRLRLFSSSAQGGAQQCSLVGEVVAVCSSALLACVS